MKARILVSAYGSSGDLFPVVPVVLALRAAGHDVRCALPRPLALFLRPHEVPVWPLGKGSEMAVVDDPAIATTRFDGWGSVRRLACNYVGSAMADDVAAVERVIAAWRPDVVVTSTFAAATRIAAYRRDVARIDLSIHPTVLARVPFASGFARSYRAGCAELAGLPAEQVGSDLVTELAWGAHEKSILLHDPLLVRRLAAPRSDSDPTLGPIGSAVGFPYWDGGLPRAAEVAAVEQWLDGSTTPLVIVTLGSYLGVRRVDLWGPIVEAVKALRARALLLGPRRALSEALGSDDSGCLAAGFVPLSTIAERAAVVVHHGGIGTMFATLHAGIPAVVVPQAFDQPTNARLVESIGAGRTASTASLRPVLASLLTDDVTRRRARAVSRTLVPSRTAIELAAGRIVNML